MHEPRPAAREGAPEYRDDAGAPHQAARPDAPNTRRRTAVRLGPRLRLALIAGLVLSLLPMPMLTEGALAAPPKRPGAEAPAKAVKLLEGQQGTAAQQQGKKKQKAKKAKQAKKAKHGAKKKAAAKKRQRQKKINVKGCVFRQRGKTWTMLRNCTPKGTIVVPNGFTLDGKNKIMVATGNAVKFDGAVVASGFGRANIRNLRIEGNAGLVGSCNDLNTGVLFYRSAGEIKNVTVRNIEVEATGCFTGNGIAAFGTDAVRVLNSTVHNAGVTGISLIGSRGGTISGNNVFIASRAIGVSAYGMDVTSATNVTVTNNDLRVGGDDSTTGLYLLGSAGVSVTNNRFHNLSYGIETYLGDPTEPTTALIHANLFSGVIVDGIYASGGYLSIVQNTIIGVTPVLGNNGLYLGADAAGAANNNVISNFACGAFDDTTAVTLGVGPAANTFLNVTTQVCT